MIKPRTSRRAVLATLLTASCWLAGGVTSSAQVPTIFAGPNLNAPAPAIVYSVPFDADAGDWFFEADLIFDPAAPPMVQDFQSPAFPSGDLILLDALQPLPFPVTENFFLTTDSNAVSEWHQELTTEGWEWVLPDDPRVLAGEPGFTDLFLPKQSLITRDGEPWASSPISRGDGEDPSKLWVEFEPILPGQVLDIHKALLWVGTPGNRFWGDGLEEARSFTSEKNILVTAFPAPEPQSLLLCVLAAAGVPLVARRRGGRGLRPLSPGQGLAIPRVG